MNIRLSHINFIAGLLFTVALLLLICGAVGLDFNVLWAAWAVLFIWCCLYVQTAYRRVSGAVLLLLGLWMVLGFPDRILHALVCTCPIIFKKACTIFLRNRQDVSDEPVVGFPFLLY